MNALSISLSFGVALLSAGIVLAQSDPERPNAIHDPVGIAGEAAPVGGTASIIDRAHGAWMEDGAVVGGGARYKVRLDASGMEYVPALGKRTRTMPLRFAVESFARGESVVHTAQPAQPTLGADHVAQYARGAGIVERFAIGADGVELSYVFPTKLAGTGDLVVRGRVATDLVAALGEHADGMRFWKDRVGGVSVGDVTGIDANGATISGSLRWDGEHLDLVLPGEFVDRAAYPLVLDPLLGVEFDVNTSATDWNDMRPDVAYDASAGVYLVVWQREFGVNDVDVRGQRVAANGTLTGSFISIAGSVDVDKHPCVADINNVNTFVVAYQTAATEFGPFDIECTIVDAFTGSVGASATIAATTANEINPDASGERVSNVNFREAIVVWEEQGVGIRACEVNVASGGLAAPPVPGPVVNISGGAEDEIPAISKSGGSAGRHCIVWQRSSTFTRAGIWDRDLTPIDTFHAVATNGKNADVDGDGTRFMVVFERFESGLSGSRDIYCQMIELSGSSIISSGTATPVEEGVNDDEFDPCVGYLGPKYLVVWSDALSGFLQSNIIGRAIGPNCEFCGNEFGAGTSTYDIQPQVGSRWASGQANDECLIVNSSVAITQIFDSNVTARRFAALGSGGAVSNIGGGCGPGGTASIVGDFAIGNTVRVALTGTTGTISALHIGLPGGSFPCGPCQITNPFLAIPVSTSGGNGTFALPLACSGFGLIGASWEFQFVSGFTLATPCVFAPTVSFSNRVNATFGL